MDQWSPIRKHSNALIRCNIAFTVLTTVAVATRLWAKTTTKKNLGIDDVTIVVAEVLWWGQTASQTFSILMARKATSLLDVHMVEYYKAVYAAGIIYFPLVLSIKLSILFFYKRTFPIPSFERLVAIVICINILWFIPGLFVDIFVCRPISTVWDNHANTPGRCINYGLYFVVITSLEMFLDVLILALPIWEVVRMRMSWRSRAVVAGIFLLGGFVVITGIVRIVISYHRGEQIPNVVTEMIWVSVHVGTAIICACLPTYRPLTRTAIDVVKNRICRVFDRNGGSKASNGPSHSGQGAGLQGSGHQYHVTVANNASGSKTFSIQGKSNQAQNKVQQGVHANDDGNIHFGSGWMLEEEDRDI